MRFYFNVDMNLCAEEDSVADFLSESFDSKEKAIEELRTRHEVCGWYECEVSIAIENLFNSHE